MAAVMLEAIPSFQRNFSEEVGLCMHKVRLTIHLETTALNSSMRFYAFYANAPVTLQPYENVKGSFGNCAHPVSQTNTWTVLYTFFNYHFGRKNVAKRDRSLKKCSQQGTPTKNTNEGPALQLR